MATATLSMPILFFLGNIAPRDVCRLVFFLCLLALSPSFFGSVPLLSLLVFASRAGRRQDTNNARTQPRKRRSGFFPFCFFQKNFFFLFRPAQGEKKRKKCTGGRKAHMGQKGEGRREVSTRSAGRLDPSPHRRDRRCACASQRWHRLQRHSTP